MGWEALEQWGHNVARIEPLAGGVANDVWSVRVKGRLAVGRLGARTDADLAWETELLQHLDRQVLTVPVPIPTSDGRLFADGLVLPHNAAGLDDVAHDIAAQAWSAWGAAVCWDPTGTDDFAAKRLAEVRAV